MHLISECERRITNNVYTWSGRRTYWDYCDWVLQGVSAQIFVEATRPSAPKLVIHEQFRPDDTLQANESLTQLDQENFIRPIHPSSRIRRGLRYSIWNNRIRRVGDNFCGITTSNAKTRTWPSKFQKNDQVSCAKNIIGSIFWNR